MIKKDHTHHFIPSDIHKDYEVCTVCGSFHSTALMDRKELYENDYWDEKNGHSYFGDQINNLTIEEINGRTKVGKILDYIVKPGNLLEIGCAPGVILNRARRKKHNVFGIEPDEKVIPEILKVSGCERERIIHGYFPEVKLPDIKFDHIVAMDVVEHIEDYRTFITTCRDLLNYDGKFIMMSPMIRDGNFRERDFCAHEHCWMFQHEYMCDYMCTLFEEVLVDAWQPGGHEMMICKKVKT